MLKSSCKLSYAASTAALALATFTTAFFLGKPVTSISASDLDTKNGLVAQVEELKKQVATLRGQMEQCSAVNEDYNRFKKEYGKRNTWFRILESAPPGNDGRVQIQVHDDGTHLTFSKNEIYLAPKSGGPVIGHIPLNLVK